MKKILINVVMISLLSGCVVNGRSGVYVRPIAITPAATTVIYEDGVIYPEYETAYAWDPHYNCYFFIGSYGVRHSMPYGWNYRTHGVPRGVYHRSHR